MKPLEPPIGERKQAPVGPLAEGEMAAASNGAYFCGDSSFFPLHRALQTIARQKLTGVLSVFWARDSVELLARDGQVNLVTTRNPSLYCEQAPVALSDLPPETVEGARARQGTDGCPMFVSLTGKDLLLPEAALQFVQEYGQRLFGRLWTGRVRFTFAERQLPDYARDLPGSGESIDQWALSTLRYVQSQELNAEELSDTSVVPAYTRDGYERVQELRLTVAEAQFASQFNGSRSLAQIAKNLRLDIKSARLTLFRFLALEMVECWPAPLAQERTSRRGIRRFFGR